MGVGAVDVSSITLSSREDAAIDGESTEGAVEDR